MAKRRSFEVQLTRLSLLSSAPLLVLLLWVMVYAEIPGSLIILTALIGGIVLVYANHQIYLRSVYQFRSLSNLLDAMIKGDYSLRARANENKGAMNELVSAMNGLAQRLSQQRMESVESQLLVRTVIDHIDVAIVALSEDNQISFINPAAKKLLQLDQSDSNDQLLKQLSFVQSFSSGYHQVIELALGRQHGRFNVHVEEFRESGLQHKLLFITDVRTLLRSEERKAWQSLVRVISHEINNSLSPIASISETLSRMIKREKSEKNATLSMENCTDLIEGLSFIAERANGLSQFVNSYRLLAKLPEPKKQMVSIIDLLNKIAISFKSQSIIIASKEDIRLLIDPVQFEQVLINLYKNAIEAMQNAKSNGSITVSWFVNGPLFKLEICDEGAGISNPDNLFVPFYTTKKHGSGIGLVLCRQVVEAHNGHLSLKNKKDTQGCCAVIEIPFLR